MLQHEFEELIGRKVTDKDYVEANYIYGMTGDMDKQEFCKHYDATKDNPIAVALVNNAIALDIRTQELESDLTGIAHAIIDEDNDRLYPKAVDLIGHAECVKYKLANGFDLNERDRELVCKALDKNTNN